MAALTAYRALANNAWHNELRAHGRLSLSWKRAEEVVNAARARHGQPARGTLPMLQEVLQVTGLDAVLPLVDAPPDLP